MKPNANVDWHARGANYIKETLTAESRADKTRLGELFNVVHQSGMAKESIADFLKGCKDALLESGMTEESAKVRLAEIRRFFRVATVALEDLEKAFKDGQGYHSIMSLCSDLAEIHDLKGKGGRKKKEAEKAPERVVIKEEYSLDEVEAVIQTLTADQVYFAALCLAARAREFAETSAFGERLVHLVDEFTLPEEAGEVEGDDEAVKAEIRNLLAQRAA